MQTACDNIVYRFGDVLALCLIAGGASLAVVAVINLIELF